MRTHPPDIARDARRSVSVDQEHLRGVMLFSAAYFAAEVFDQLANERRIGRRHPVRQIWNFLPSHCITLKRSEPSASRTTS